MSSTTYYKYRNFDNEIFLKDIFKNNEMYASAFDKLNDPMDSFFEHKSSVNKSFLDEIHNDKYKHKVLSLSETYDNILMWTHYANNHTGIVIGVNIEENDNIYIDKVEYKSKLPEFDSSKENDTNYKKKFAKKVLMTKLLPWKYEQEIRVLSENNHVKVKIKEIYFGCKIKDEDMETIKGCIKKEKIEIKNISIDDLNTQMKWKTK